jgi:hypothetical protein
MVKETRINFEPESFMPKHPNLFIQGKTSVLVIFPPALHAQVVLA